MNEIELSFAVDYSDLLTYVTDKGFTGELLTDYYLGPKARLRKYGTTTNPGSVDLTIKSSTHKEAPRKELNLMVQSCVVGDKLELDEDLFDLVIVKDRHVLSDHSIFFDLVLEPISVGFVEIEFPNEEVFNDAKTIAEQMELQWNIESAYPYFNSRACSKNIRVQPMNKVIAYLNTLIDKHLA